MTQGKEDWFEDNTEDQEDTQITEYDISSAPNDFNVKTLFDLVQSGKVRIPGFQRNYVWDISQASKLIESLIIGLPVPQLFLYQKDANSFLVIDGQQRLMSVFYFMKMRFPRKNKRVDIRTYYDHEKIIPNEILSDDTFFQPFKLKLPKPTPEHKNKLDGLNYETLGEYKDSFSYRPIRSIIVKQNIPSDDDSSMYEVFNRLNTGGVNLRPQEIRSSMYDSDFYNMLNRINTEKEWRKILKRSELDLHLKDIEILLRGFAMLIYKNNYTTSMVKFLNSFSKHCSKYTDKENEYLNSLFISFLSSCCNLPDGVFINKFNNRFNIVLYEAVFSAVCENAYNNNEIINGYLDKMDIEALINDAAFKNASIEGTTKTHNVKTRIERARTLIHLKKE